MAHTGEAVCFCVASSDGDIAPLAPILNGIGCDVHGVGKKDSARKLVSGCATFRELHPNETRVAPATEHGKPEDNIRKVVEEAICAATEPDGWALLSTVMNQVHMRIPGFSTRTYGFRKASEFTLAQDYLDTASTANASNPHIHMKVRIKPATQKPPAKRQANGHKEVTAKC